MGVLSDLGVPSALDDVVRRRLADSVEHIGDRAGPHLGTNPAEIRGLVTLIRSQRQLPGVFARYYDLVPAVLTNQFAAADRLLAEMGAMAGATVRFSADPFNRERLGDDFERFPRLLFAEYSDVSPIAEPGQAAFADAARWLDEAVGIIGAVDPAMQREILDLFGRIYVGVGSDEPGVRGFGGVTSFMVWGASFLNIEAYPSRWQAVQYLVHEVTHALLFALSPDEPMVLNPISETYASPLRPDPRPMDGIFHATAVCARLVEFNRRWLGTDLFDGDEREAVERTTSAYLSKFGGGVDVIERHGELSTLGRDVLRRCEGAVLVDA